MSLITFRANAMYIHFKFEFVRVSGFQARPPKKNTFTRVPK